MDLANFLIQILNSVQYGLLLFMLAAGLTLIFGIMGVINLAHGSLYMIGAYAMAAVAASTGSFLLAFPAGLAAAGLAGVLMEYLIVRRLYARDHLDQVLATFGLILFFNQLTTILFGRQPLFVQIPAFLDGSVMIGGMAHIAGSVMAAYIGLLGGGDAHVQVVEVAEPRRHQRRIVDELRPWQC